MYTAPEVLEGDYYDENVIYGVVELYYICLYLVNLRIIIYKYNRPDVNNVNEMLKLFENVKLLIFSDPSISNDAKDLLS